MTENKLNWMVKLTAHLSKVNIFSDSCVNVMWGNVLSSWLEQGTSMISFFFVTEALGLTKDRVNQELWQLSLNLNCLKIVAQFKIQ